MLTPHDLNLSEKFTLSRKDETMGGKRFNLGVMSVLVTLMVAPPERRA